MDKHKNLAGMLQDTEKQGWQVFMTLSHNPEDGRVLVSLREGVREQLTDVMRQAILDAVRDSVQKRASA